MELDPLKRLQGQIRELEMNGEAVTSRMATNFPRNVPPPGISYSLNFARFQKDGRFSLQVK